jgi:hypothetical protein
MEKKPIKKDDLKTPETRYPDSSWHPDTAKEPIHSKMDWMDDVRFKSVRGVEIHASSAPLLHPHND